MQNDGQLVVKDGDGAVIWSSRTETGTSTAARGWTYQITSNGKPGVSCLFSGPSPAAVYMPSQDNAYKLQVTQSGAALSLVASDGQLVWSPSGAAAGSPPARMCITSAGKLELSGNGGASKLWASTYATAGIKAGGYYAAFISSDGCLEVVDGTCQLLYSTTLTPGNSSANQQRPQPVARFKLTPPDARAARNTTTGTSSTRKPPPVRSKRSPPAAGVISLPAPRASRASKPPSASSAVSPPSRASKVPGAPRAASAAGACTLAVGSVCGGVSLCGVDRQCPAKGCCAGTTACRRHNEFTWRCQ